MQRVPRRHADQPADRADHGHRGEYEAHGLSRRHADRLADTQVVDAFAGVEDHGVEYAETGHGDEHEGEQNSHCGHDEDDAVLPRLGVGRGVASQRLYDCGDLLGVCVGGDAGLRFDEEGAGLGRLEVGHVRVDLQPAARRVEGLAHDPQVRGLLLVGHPHRVTDLGAGPFQEARGHHDLSFAGDPVPGEQLVAGGARIALVEAGLDRS